MAMTIGELNVKLTAEVADIKRKLGDVKEQLEGVHKASRNTTSSLMLFSKASIIAGAAIAGAIAVYKLFIKPAMDAEEAFSKFNILFKENASAVNDWATSTAKNIGRGVAEIRSMTADMFALISPMGLAREESIEMSKRLVILAEDLDSFHNLAGGASEALLKLRSGLMGEAEPMRALGIDVSDTALKIYALSHGIKKSTEDMSMGEKAALRYKMMIEGAGEANGDAARTIDSTTNQIRLFQANLSELAVSIGETILPALNAFVTGINSIINAIKELKESSDKAVNNAAWEKSEKNWQDQINHTKEYEHALKVLGMTSEEFQAKNLARIDALGDLARRQAQYDREGWIYFEAIETKKANTVVANNAVILKSAADLAKKKTDFEQKIHTEYLTLTDDKYKLLEEEKNREIATAEELGVKKEEIEKNYQIKKDKIDNEMIDNFINHWKTALSAVGTVTMALGGILSQLNQNESIEFDNRQHRKMEEIQDTYDAEKAAIEGSVLTEKEKAEKLKALDEKRARDEKKLNEKLDKEKRKSAHEGAKWSKALGIMQSVTNTAVAVTNALGTWPPGPWNIALAATIGALGGIQTALIAAQPLPALARGGLFSGPALIGEAGRELAFPLEGDAGKSAIRGMASGILDMLSENLDIRASVDKSEPMQSTIHNVVYLDSDIIAESMSRASDNGKLRINSRSVMQ